MDPGPRKLLKPIKGFRILSVHHLSIFMVRRLSTAKNFF